MSGDERRSISQSGLTLRSWGARGISRSAAVYRSRQSAGIPGGELIPVARGDQGREDRVWKHLDKAVLELTPRPRELPRSVRLL